MSEEQGREQNKLGEERSTEEETGISKHDLGEYMGHGEEELGRERTGDPDRMAETSPPHPDRTSEITERERPNFTTSVDQRDLDTPRDEETKGMAIKEDAEPGADAQGG